MKKDTGRLLTSYKDRYIHVEKTELVIYENEVQFFVLRLTENFPHLLFCLEKSAFLFAKMNHNVAHRPTFISDF